jgi:hypothetical protein
MTSNGISATTTYVVWSEEHLWDVSVLHSVRSSILVFVFTRLFIYLWFI